MVAEAEEEPEDAELLASRAVLRVFSTDRTHLEPNLRPTPRSHPEYGQSGRSTTSSHRTALAAVAAEREEVVVVVAAKPAVVARGVAPPNIVSYEVCNTPAGLVAGLVVLFVSLSSELSDAAVVVSVLFLSFSASREGRAEEEEIEEEAEIVVVAVVL